MVTEEEEVEDDGAEDNEVIFDQDKEHQFTIIKYSNTNSPLLEKNYLTLYTLNPQISIFLKSASSMTKCFDWVIC